MTKKHLTHLDSTGKASMVDVGDKSVTDRSAVARGMVTMQKDTLELIKAGEMKKGDVLTVAQIAGISAAKNTSGLIPLCHPIQLNSIKIDFEFDDDLPGIIIRAEAKTSARTGVEMEALTAVSVAALTIYDMAKSAEKTLCIGDICLVEKKGGKFGDFFKEISGKK
jgi:cyclic pyranopterin phosphate synthase